jgi:hypothetical protein
MNDLPDHPDIRHAERTGYPVGGEPNEPESTECENCCRLITEDEEAKCTQCGRQGCCFCLELDEDIDEYFCPPPNLTDDGCRNE